MIRCGVPSGNKAANDRALTMDEVRRLVEYPDARIKPIVYLMVSACIRLESACYSILYHGVNILTNLMMMSGVG
jgi:hypothetical protein